VTSWFLQNILTSKSLKTNKYLLQIAFVAGAFLAFYVTPAWYFYMDDAGFGQALWVIGGPIFALIGACIGSYLGVLWKKRLPL